MKNKKELVQRMGQLRDGLSYKELDQDYLTLKLSEDLETLEYIENKYFNGQTTKLK
tara:strand:+ start:247 stop:414 length:168 start_codon:yes stop_codon:yes gene_type:complete